MPSKKQIESVEWAYGEYYLCIPFSELRKLLDEIEERLNKDYSNVSNIGFFYDPYGNDGGYTIHVSCTRDETDLELKQRLEREQHYREIKKKREEKREDREKKLYEKLRKKYGLRS